MPPARRRRSPAVPSPYDSRPWLGAYPEGVPADYDFPVVPVTRLLDDAAASFPTGRAVLFLGTTLTYRELRTQVDAFASGLSGLGVGKGDRVALVLPNCPQNVIAFFAVLRLGAVVVQQNPLSTEAELRHQLADSGARVVVCLDRVQPAVAAVQAQTSVEHVVVTSLADYLPASARLRLRLPTRSARRRRAELVADLPKGARVRQFAELVAGSTPARQVAVDPLTDLALLQYTGGTTGVPQGARITHHNLVADTYMNRLWDVEATAGKETTLLVLPLFHVFGLTVGMLGTVLLSGTLVLVPRFDVDAVLDAVEAHRPTLFPGVPPLFRALAESPKTRGRDLRSLRLCLSGAMRLPREVQERFEKVTGARLVEGYGTTETSPTTHCCPTTGDERRHGSIGVPLPGTRAKLVDPQDASREVPVGEPGELAVAGPQVFAGYWGSDERGLTDDGYLLLGDIAVMDEDGWFTVVDRKKELIITGGFNVYPSEVEAVLAQLPGVGESAVVGVPDRHRGETVKAFVVARDAGLTVEDVLAHCAEQLTAYKVPKSVELVEDLPRSAVGKVLRRVLVEQERAAAGEPERLASTPGGRARRTAPRDEDLPTGPEPGPRQADPGPTTVDAPAPASAPGKASRTTRAAAPSRTRAQQPAEPPAKKAAKKASPPRRPAP